jgi:predicted amidophosphoribosyltransferase
VAYTGAVRPLVRVWKEHGLRRVADLAADLVVQALAPPAADVITYIPADPDRLLRRGHHPAERLARGLGERWQVETVPLLVRHGARRRQAALTRVDRARNVREAFVAVAEPAARIVLVDDVFTTGATAAAGAQALRRAGAERVDVVTFARTIRV